MSTSQYSGEIRAHVHALLAEHGYRMSAGDHVRVLDAMAKVCSVAEKRHMFDDKSALVVAREILGEPGLPQGKRSRVRQWEPSAEEAAASDWLDGKEKAILEVLVARLRGIMLPPSTEMIEEMAGPYIAQLLEGRKSVIEWEQTPWDCSSHGRRTKERYVLSDYETLADFLDEPTGETEPTFMSGMGFRARKYEDDFWTDAFEPLTEAGRRMLVEHFADLVTKAGFSPEGAPSAEDIWDMLVHSYWDVLCDSCLDLDFREAIRAMPIVDLIARIRPIVDIPGV